MTSADDNLITITRAATITGLSYAVLYGAGVRGHIRLRRIGSRILVPLKDLEEFAAFRGTRETRRRTLLEPNP